MILTEKDITGTDARLMREKAGLTQKAFWGPLGVQQSVGCRYESDMPMPNSVRILVFAFYVGGLRLNVSTPQGVEDLTRLVAIQSSFREAARLASEIRTNIDRAAKNLVAAREAVASI